MSDKPTPETDAKASPHIGFYSCATVPAEFARKLERERDEAREDSAHWKVEYEIVGARLCGWKHPRDNGIIFEHEIIPKLTQERDKAMEDAVSYEAMLNIERENAEELKAECNKLREAILSTLEENRYLADGDDCTLFKLKSVVPEWK